MSRLAGSRAGRWATFIWGGFALGCGVAYVASLSCGLVIPLGCLAGACSLVCVAFAPRMMVPIALVSTALVVGVLRGSSAVTVPGPGSVSGHLGTRPVVVLGTVRSADPGPGSTAIVDASHVSDADTDGRVTGGVLVSGPLIPALLPGDQVEIDASGLRALDRRPGANSAQTLEREDVEAMATSPQVFVVAAGGPSPLARSRGPRRSCTLLSTTPSPSPPRPSPWASPSGSTRHSPPVCAPPSRMPA